MVRQFMRSTGMDRSRRIVTRTPMIPSTMPTEDAAAVPSRVQTWNCVQQKPPLLRPEMADVPSRQRSQKRAVTQFADGQNGRLASDREREREVARFADERNVRLVWRRASSTFSEEERLERNSTEPADRAHTSQQPANQSVPDVARLVEREAAKQMTQLDPALLDRLTDNVISRVEKRIKIERQRRGL